MNVALAASRGLCRSRPSCLTRALLSPFRPKVAIVAVMHTSSTNRTKMSPTLSVRCSPMRQAPPALVAILLKPASRLAAILVGRRLRNWYRNLPEEERRKIKNKLKKNRHVFVGEWWSSTP